MKKYFIGVMITLLFSFPQNQFSTEDYSLTVVKLFDNLDNPWGFDYLPDGRVLLSEKPGKVWILDLAKKTKKELAFSQAVKDTGQGGLMDVLVHPRFSKKTPYVYFTFTRAEKGFMGGSGTALVRYNFINDKLVNKKILFIGKPFTSSGRHFGSRVRMDKNDFLYLSLGDRGNRPSAQNLENHYGSIIRLNQDGSIPKDNPFAKGSKNLPEIYTYGHRNPQGMAIHPKTGAIWTGEHGAKGGDEINLIQSGKNYGWPVISYGKHYTGFKIGEGTHKKGMEQPLFYWDPSIAPAGMTFYNGKLFPKWNNNLFVSSLKFGFISRLTTSHNTITKEERILKNGFQRIRDIKQSPKDSLMFITDAGGFYEILPKK